LLTNQEVVKRKPKSNQEVVTRKPKSAKTKIKQVGVHKAAVGGKRGESKDQSEQEMVV
jgi:hypothetical protein